MKRMSAAQALRYADAPSLRLIRGGAGLGGVNDWDGSFTDGDEEIDENGDSYPSPVDPVETQDAPQFESGMYDVPEDSAEPSDAGAGIIPAIWWWSENAGDSEPAPGTPSAYDTDGTLYADPITIGDTLGSPPYDAGFAKGLADKSAGAEYNAKVPLKYADQATRWTAGYEDGWAAGGVVDDEPSGGGGGGGTIIKTPTTGGSKKPGTTTIGGGASAEDDDPNYLAYGLIGAGVVALGAIGVHVYRKRKKARQ